MNLHDALTPILQYLEVSLKYPFLAECMNVSRDHFLDVMRPLTWTQEHHDHFKQLIQCLLIFDGIQVPVSALDFFVRVQEFGVIEGLERFFLFFWEGLGMVVESTMGEGKVFIWSCAEGRGELMILFQDVVEWPIEKVLGKLAWALEKVSYNL